MTARTLLLALVTACGGTGGTGHTADADAPDAPAPTKAGGVTLRSSGAGYASAGFGDGGSLCRLTASSGACQFFMCTDVLPPSASYSAGVLTIAGATIPISLVPDASNTYSSLQTEGDLFVGGESLMLSAPGDQVPAFTAMVTAPVRPTITSPAAPTTQPLVITRSAGLTVTWGDGSTGGGSTGWVHAVVAGGPNASTEVECRFDAAAGTGTIPAELLMMVPTGDPGWYRFEGLAVDEVDAGDWAVAFSAVYQAVWPSGLGASGEATVE